MAATKAWRDVAMSQGPNEEVRKQTIARNGRVAIGDIVGGLLFKHEQHIQAGLHSGEMPEQVRCDFAALNLTATDIVMLLNDSSCRQALGSVLRAPQLRTAELSLGDLVSVFAPSSSSDKQRLLQACQLFLSTPETSPVGSIILKATFYVSFPDGSDVLPLREAVQRMHARLTEYAFENWRNVASKHLLCSYSSLQGGASPSGYMEAAQLADGCFGSLEDPQALLHALELLREFVPHRQSETDGLYSRPVPACLWDGFASDAQKRLLRAIDLHKEVVPWMKEMLVEVRRGLRYCAELCSDYRGERMSHTWDSEEHFQRKEAPILALFDRSTAMLADVCRFCAIAVEHAFEEQKNELAQRKLRTKLQKVLGPDITETVYSLCSAVGERDFRFPCSSRLALALEELVQQKLELPLDLALEGERNSGQESVYQRGLLPAFQHALERGDLESALNLRMLFPLEGAGVTRRDTIDQYIDEHQSEMIAGVRAASEQIKQLAELGPDHERLIDVFRRGLLFLVRPELVRLSDLRLCNAAADVVQALISRDSTQHTSSMTTYWGCLQAGLVLQRLRKNPELMEQVASKALAKHNVRLLPTLAEYFALFNGDQEYGIYTGPVETLWNACRVFHEALPSPKIRHLTGVERMKGVVDAAFDKWRGGLYGNVSIDPRDLFRVELFITPAAAQPGQSETRTVGLFGELGRTSREAHAAMMLRDWESHVADAGTSLVPQAYRMHVQYLLAEGSRLLKNIDSADFEPEAFQAVFAELFVGFLRGGNSISDGERRLIAKCMMRMLQCPKSGFVCSKDILRQTVTGWFQDYVRQSQQPNGDDPKQLLASRQIMELLEHWGFELTGI